MKAIVITAVLGVGFLIAWWKFIRTDPVPSEIGSRAMISLFGDAIDRQSRSLSGCSATNCGHVKPREDPKAGSDCALAAVANNRPFRVRYDSVGIDTLVSVSFVRTSDNRLIRLNQFDMSFGDSLSSQNVIVNPCPEPLRMTKTGYLTCIPVD